MIKRHFLQRATEVGDIEDDGSHYPMILSMWHAEIKKDRIAHLAVRLAREEQQRAEARLGPALRRGAKKKPGPHTNDLILQFYREEAAKAAKGDT